MPLIMHPTSYGSPTIHGAMNTIYIGKYCAIANSATFDGGMQHNTRFVTMYPLWRLGAHKTERGMCNGDIHVGNDVWIGDGALIMSGVTIGDGAVIGARAVVTRNVSPYSVIVGAMRIARWRFRIDQIERLRRIAWWDWAEEKVLENAHILLQDDIELFLKAHEVQKQGEEYEMGN